MKPEHPLQNITFGPKHTTLLLTITNKLVRMIIAIQSRRLSISPSSFQTTYTPVHYTLTPVNRLPMLIRILTRGSEHVQPPHHGTALLDRDLTTMLHFFLYILSGRQK